MIEVVSWPPVLSPPWSVEKVTFGGRGHEVLQGVAWNLPASLLAAQGGRLTESLAVSVMPTPRQPQAGQPASGPAVTPMAAKAHAGITRRTPRRSGCPGRTRGPLSS